jgi:polyphenol oxidase
MQSVDRGGGRGQVFFMKNAFLEPLRALPWLRVDFIDRVADVPMDVDRDEAMRRLRGHHSGAVEALGFPLDRWWRAEQVHGVEVAEAGAAETVLAPDGLPVIAGVDGLICGEPGICLAIYVADCGAIWLADRVNGAVGLLHSGKKGTEGNILGRAVAMMGERYGSRPEDLIGVLGPCIRPPHYEVDFAAEIVRQAVEAGVGEFHDCKTCTASDLHRFYSYRKERGRTGRMMALIGSLPHS